MNAANILKPALSRGEIQVIGATTFTEYRKHIEKDTALERRFQPVTVNEPSLEDTLKILQGIAHYYENYHGVSIPQGVLRQAVVLSERYITDRFLPDKAIDLIDEACSDMNLHDPDINRRMEVKRDLENVTFERENLMSAQPAEGQEFTQEELDARYARIAELRSQELRLQQELSDLDADFRQVCREKKRDLLVFGDRFPLLYFCREYGLRYRAAFHGCSSDTEPSLYTLKFLIDKVREEQIPVVYALELSSQRVAEAIAETTGARVVTFYSCQTVSQADWAAGEGYLSLMRRNVAALREGIC